MVSTFAEGLLQRSRAAEPICSFCEGARAADMRAAPANSRKVLGGESFEHDREGHRGEKLLLSLGHFRAVLRGVSFYLARLGVFRITPHAPFTAELSADWQETYAPHTLPDQAPCEFTGSSQVFFS